MPTGVYKHKPNKGSFKKGTEKNLHPAWKGNNISYGGFHKRVAKEKGCPKKCELCGTKSKKRKYDWANLTGEYNNPKDYKRMCISCHRKYDFERKRNGDNKHKKESTPAV